MTFWSVLTYIGMGLAFIAAAAALGFALFMLFALAAWMNDGSH